MKEYWMIALVRTLKHALLDEKDSLMKEYWMIALVRTLKHALLDKKTPGTPTAPICT